MVYDEDKEYPVNIPVFTKRIMVSSKENYAPWLIGIGSLLGLGLTVLLFVWKRKSNKSKSAYLPKAIAKQARKGIEDGKIEPTIALLATKTIHISEELKNQLSALSAEHSDANRKFGVNLMEEERFGRILSRINFTLLEIISGLEKGENG